MPPIIEAQGLTKAFGDVHALAGLDLVAQSGQVTASGSPDELKGLAGRDVIEIRPRHDADLAAMATVLATVAAETPRIDTDTQRTTAAVDGGAEQLATVVRLLDEQGLVVDDIGLRRPTLDEVFLTLTGNPIEPDGASPADAA